jgi:diguanylate cyclase (GGDEF)-like protein
LHDGFDRLPVAALSTRAGIVIDANALAHEVLGPLGAGELIGRSCADLVAGAVADADRARALDALAALDGAPRIVEVARRAARGTEDERFELHVRGDRDTGTTAVVWLSRRLRADGARSIPPDPLGPLDSLGELGSLGELDARATTERLTHMLDATADYVAVFKPSGEVLYVNAATQRLLDALVADGREGRLVDLIDDEPRRAWIAAAMEVIEHADGWEGELVLNAGGGRTIPVSAVGVVRKQADGSLEWIAMHGRDITESKLAQERQRELATHDYLTGLPNRALFIDRLDHAAARHRREQRGVAVMFCDLDGFKGINDEHGHAAGDRVLVVVAERLRAITRESDTAARVGGDEFVVVCEGITDFDELGALADRLIASVSRPIVIGSHSSGEDAVSVRVGISVGIAVARPDLVQVDPDKLLTTADTAMYRAKARGGNTFRITPLEM